jgi:hypothetical protein
MIHCETHSIWRRSMTAAAALRLTALMSCLVAAPFVWPVADARADDPPVRSATTADGRVRVDVLSLKRTEGDTVTLRFAVVNNSNADFSVALLNLRLIDLMARRYYDVGLSSSSCTSAPDKQVTCWAMFAAPPASTRTIAIKFYERLDLITGVPITE